MGRSATGVRTEVWRGIAAASSDRAGAPDYRKQVNGPFRAGEHSNTIPKALPWADGIGPTGRKTDIWKRRCSNTGVRSEKSRNFKTRQRGEPARKARHRRTIIIPRWRVGLTGMHCERAIPHRRSAASDRRVSVGLLPARPRERTGVRVRVGGVGASTAPQTHATRKPHNASR